MSKAIQKYTQETIKQANLDVMSGRKILVLETNDVTTRLSDVNIAGLVLLKNSFEELLNTPKDMGMAASMYAHKYLRITPKQKKYLVDMLRTYLKIETLEDAVALHNAA